MRRDFDLSGATLFAGGEEAADKGKADGVLITLSHKSQVTLHGQGEVRTLPQEPVPDGELGYSLAEFLGAIRERRQPETHVVEHIRSLALLMAVVESSRRGGPVEVANLAGFLE